MPVKTTRPAFGQYVRERWLSTYPLALHDTRFKHAAVSEMAHPSLPPLVWCWGPNICPYSTVLGFIALVGKTKLDEGLRRENGKFEVREGWRICLVSVFILKSYLVDLKSVISCCGSWFPLVLVNTVNFSSRNLVTTQLGLMKEECCGTASLPTLGIFQLLILAILVGM